MTPPRRVTVARALTLAAVLVAAAGCSISVDQTARPVADVPEDLFSTTTATTIEEAEPGLTLELYFINEANALVLVERSRDTAATTQDAIDALLTNPTPEEIEDPSFGTPQTKLVSAQYSAPPAPDADGVLVVTVSGDELFKLTDLDPERVESIYRQVVCTLTGMDLGISAVAVRDDTGVIPVRLADADTPVDRPVGRADLGDCVIVEPPPPPTTAPRSTTTTRRLPQPSTSSTTLPSSTTPAS